MNTLNLTVFSLSVVVVGCNPSTLQSTDKPSITAAEGGAKPSAAVPPKAGAPERKPGTDKAKAGAEEARVWHFDDRPAGPPAAEIVASVGRWELVDDKAAPSGGRVLAQVAASGGSTFNVALLSDTQLVDVDLSVQIRAVSGDIDQGGGLVWRAADARNYYVVRYNPLEDNYRLYKIVDGSRSMLKGATVRVDHAAWHQVRVVMHGELIECYLDGKKHLEFRDSTFKGAGKIGLWTKADAATRFDDLKAN